MWRQIVLVSAQRGRRGSTQRMICQNSCEKTQWNLLNEVNLLTLFICCCLLLCTRRRFLPITAAPSMQKCWGLQMSWIRRSGPLNRLPRKPCCKSSRRHACSPPALTQHQEVCVSADTRTSPVYVCVCTHQMHDSVRFMNCSNLVFPVTTFTLWSDKPPHCFRFHSKEIEDWASWATILTSSTPPAIKTTFKMPWVWYVENCRVCVCASAYTVLLSTVYTL